MLSSSRRRTQAPLTLTQLEETPDDSATPPNTTTPRVSVFTRNTVVRVIDGLSLKQIEAHSFLDNTSLVDQAREYFVGCLMAEVDAIRSLGPRRDALISKILPRIVNFKQLSPAYSTHWTFNTLTDNICTLCDVLALANKIPLNIDSLASTEQLLRSMEASAYRSLSTNADENVNNKMLQGVGLYYDKERGSFRKCASVHGTDDKNFKWRYDQDVKQSKIPNAPNAFSRNYPYTKPSLQTEGGY